MSAHFAAVVPKLVTVKPRIDAGHLRLPTGPGWSVELDEAAVRAHPPRTGAYTERGAGSRAARQRALTGG